MRTFGNILWLVLFLGFIDALLVWLLAGFFALTIVGIPIAKGLWEFGKFLFWPFGNEMVDESILEQKPASCAGVAWGTWSLIMSVIWVVFFGIWLWIAAVIQIISLFLSIIGIPVGLVIAKSLGTFFNPVGKVCVPTEIRTDFRRERAQKKYMCD